MDPSVKPMLLELIKKQDANQTGQVPLKFFLQQLALLRITFNPSQRRNLHQFVKNGLVQYQIAIEALTRRSDGSWVIPSARVNMSKDDWKFVIAKFQESDKGTGVLRVQDFEKLMIDWEKWPSIRTQVLGKILQGNSVYLGKIYKQMEGKDDIEQLCVQVIQQMRMKFIEFPNAFYIFDNNKDGRLNLQEFTKGLQVFNIRMTISDIVKVFMFLDKDKNGYLDFKEFCTMLAGQDSKKFLKLGVKFSELQQQLSSNSQKSLSKGNWASAKRGNQFASSNILPFFASKKYEEL